jgi:hypothetical protein
LSADSGPTSRTPSNISFWSINDDGTASPALIAMKSTQLKKGRKWNSMIQGRTAMGKNGPFQMPRFSNVYLLRNRRRRKTPKAHGTGGTWRWKA